MINDFKSNKVEMTAEELRNNLEQFWGEENAGAYWLLQEINILYVKLGCPVFLNIIVKSNKKKADIIIYDSNDKVLDKKHLSFTDLPEGEWQFFFNR